MAKKRNSGDYYQTLRARFAGEESDTPDARFRPPADTTDQFFGASPAADESRAPRLFDPAAVRPLADGLSRRINAHGAAETTLFAQLLRLLVGVVWLGAAGWYAARVSGTDGAALATLFTVIAGAAIAAAVCNTLITLATGKASLNRTRADAVVLGQRLALETQSLNAALDRPGRARIDGVSADVFLKATAFANGDEMGPQGFRHFLKRDSAPLSANGGARLFLIALGAVVLLAAALGLGATASPLPLAGYPVALTAVALGAALYAGAGMIARLCAGSRRARREDRAEAAAFSAMQSAFSAARGIAPADLSARLHQPGAANAMTNRSLDETREFESSPASDFHKRADDSRPTFVETAFHAAPKAFRTDAFEKKFRR